MAANDLIEINSIVRRCQKAAAEPVPAAESRSEWVRGPLDFSQYLVETITVIILRIIDVDHRQAAGVVRDNGAIAVAYIQEVNT